MRLRNGHYECTLCGAVLDLAEGVTPLVMLRASSGEPTMRTISVNGKEVHSCPVGEASSPGPVSLSLTDPPA
jgi:hypothetical protein